MGLRLRKRVKIAPGVYVNIGKKGINSISGRAGPLTLNKNFHTGQTRLTTSAHGTGLSYTATLSKGTAAAPSRQSAVSERRIDDAHVSSPAIVAAILGWISLIAAGGLTVALFNAGSVFGGVGLLVAALSVFGFSRFFFSPTFSSALTKHAEAMVPDDAPTQLQEPVVISTASTIASNVIAPPVSADILDTASVRHAPVVVDNRDLLIPIASPEVIPPNMTGDPDIDQELRFIDGEIEFWRRKGGLVGVDSWIETRQRLFNSAKKPAY